ncbi:MAG TPA: hypothetical protein VJT50_07945 [Pyrinomonadaceae bacterium]|nr:hypothetical protein [Pyrinomonadaceae bacterium]
MTKLVRSCALLMLGTFVLSCQSYTTGLQQSVARADEASALAAMKAISSAQQMYSVSNNGAYASFQQLCEAGLLDERFNSANPQIKDYIFTMETGTNTYRINADPAGSGDKAGRHLYMDSTGPLIRVNNTQAAGASDPLMQP